MVTINDIAKATNLSKSTVSKHINGEKVRENNRKKLEQAISESGYRPNHIAKGLKTTKTFTVGVLVPFLTDIFAATIISIIEEKIKEKGYAVLVANYQGSKKGFKEKLELFYDKMTDAVIVFPSGISENDFDVKNAKTPPFLLIDKMLKIENSCSILIDNADICYKAAKHLCENGHRKIAVITGNEKSFTANERARGCMKAFEEFGICRDKYLIEFGDFSFEGGYNIASKIFKERKDITAIFATNYYITNGVLKCANDNNIVIPDDFSFVGFDSIEISNIYKVPLTLVTQPMKEIGEKSAEVILDMLSGIVPKEKSFIHLGSLKHGKSVKRI